MLNLTENIDISYEWLTKEIFKQTVKQKQTGKKTVVQIEYIKLLQIFKKFVELNIKMH